MTMTMTWMIVAESVDMGCLAMSLLLAGKANKMVLRLPVVDPRKSLAFLFS